MKKLISIIILFFLLTACDNNISESNSSNGNNSFDNVSSQNNSIDYDNNSNYISSKSTTAVSNIVSSKIDLDNIKLTDLPTVISYYFDYEKPIYLISELPNDNIYLYGLVNTETGKEFGVILRINDILYRFEWDYYTPRSFLPEMCYSDYDNDGEKELAISLYVGSGTGVSIEELHILEFNGKGEPTDNFFIVENSIKELNSEITFNFNDNTKIFIVYFKNQSIKYYNEYELGIKSPEVNGEIIDFAFKKNKIIASFGIEINSHYIYCGTITAEINYCNNSFDIENCLLQDNNYDWLNR